MNLQQDSTMGWNPVRRKGAPRDVIMATVSVVVMALLVYIPYAEALNSFFAFQVAGYSILVTAVPAALSLALLMLLGLRRPLPVVLTFVSLGLAILVILARSAFGISEENSVTFRAVTGMRYFALLPCYLALANAACGVRWFRCWAPRVIVFNGVVNALVGILYAVGLSTFKVIGVDENVQTLVANDVVTRASGLFAGSNMFANFLVLSILVCIVSRWNIAVKTTACFLLFGGIVAGQSRFALGSAVIAVIWYTSREKVHAWKKMLGIITLAAALVGTPFLVRNASDSLIARFDTSEVDNDSTTRLEKTTLGLRAVFSGWDTILLGARLSDVVINDSLQISDNSYIAVLTSAGLPLTILFLLLLRTCFRKMKHRDAQRRAIGPFWMIALTAALLNNAIYWDSWLYCLAIIYGILGRGGTTTPKLPRSIVGFQAFEFGVAAHGTPVGGSYPPASI